MRLVTLLIGILSFCGTSFSGEEPIFLAIQEGKLEPVKTIVKSDPAALDKFNDPNYGGGTPLCHAAGHGNIAIMNFLISAGADTNKFDEKTMRSPLFAAVQNEKREAVKLLLKSGADVNLTIKYSYENWTPLSRARTMEMAELLIESGARVNDGRALYHVISASSEHENLEKVAVLLLEKGADPNGDHVMWRAAQSGSVRLMKLLLEKGGSLTKGIAQNNWYSPLAEASDPKQIEVAKLLIEHGADVNARGEFGYWPLQRATAMGNDSLVELLIAKGANIEAPTREGHAIHDAIFARHTSTVALLASKGATLDAPAYAALGKIDELKKALASDPALAQKTFTDQRWTLLHISAAHDQAASADVLVLAGADVNAKLASGNFTPLHIAAERGSNLVAQVLIANHGDVHARTGDHMYGYGLRTPLMTAAARTHFTPHTTGHDAVIKLLVAAGADVNAIGEAKSMALDLARNAKHQSTVDMLLQAGAKSGNGRQTE